MEITATTVDEAGLTCTRYAAAEGGAEIGYLLAHETGLILNVEVDEDRRGEGIARALYEHADNVQGLYHVPAWGRTPEGDAFATAMGGDVMDDKQAAAIVGMDLSIYEVEDDETNEW